MLIYNDFSAVYKNGRQGNKARLIVSENKIVGALCVKPSVLRTFGAVVFNKNVIVNELVRAEFCVFGFEDVNRLFGTADMQVVSDCNVLGRTRFVPAKCIVCDKHTGTAEVYKGVVFNNNLASCRSEEALCCNTACVTTGDINVGCCRNVFNNEIGLEAVCSLVEGKLNVIGVDKLCREHLCLVLAKHIFGIANLYGIACAEYIEIVGIGLNKLCNNLVALGFGNLHIGSVNVYGVVMKTAENAVCNVYLTAAV